MKTIKTLKKILIIVIILQLMILPTVSNAAGSFSWSDVFKTGSDFINKAKEENVIEDPDDPSIKQELIKDEEIQSTTSVIFNALLAIGIVLTVIVGGVLGIKLMMASAEDKAKIKEAFIPYILGCVVIFGAFGIWKLVVSILNNL